MIVHRLLHDRYTRIAIFACFALIFNAADARAQQYAAAQGDGGAPQFLFVSSRGEVPVPVDAGSIPALGRRIDLDLSDVTIDDALRAIATLSRLPVVYSAQVVPVEKHVSVKATGITVAAALTEVLFKANVDVLLSGGRIVLVRRREPRQVGTIAGRVTDSTNGEGLAGVSVVVEGSQLRTTTKADGSYSLQSVPAGMHTIAARRLGYARKAHSVTIEDGATVSVDFVMSRVATTLDEVVTTATGDRRRVELGHVVGHINADSIAKAAPVSSLSEILTDRVAGVQVNSYQGTLGGDVSLQVRSPNTIQLSTQPIVIVDGIRYTSTAAGRVGQSDVNYVEPSSPINDLNPNDIATIEVAKGPSAATLYGTDAANGVIVVTTKRGSPGPARWSVYLKSAVTEIPHHDYEQAYWGWRTQGGVTSPYTCSLVGRATLGCTQDSVTAIRSPLTDPQLTIFATKPRWQSGVNVSGGSPDLRFYVAGDVESATGPLRMPPATLDSISGVRSVPAEQREPNAFSKNNLRSNLAVSLSHNADVQFNLGYTQRETRTLGGGFSNPYAQALTYPTPQKPFGAGGGPEEYFSRTTTERSSRLLGSATAHWSPTSWLISRISSGVDLANITRSSLSARGDAPNASYGQFSLGAVSADRGRQMAATTELGATATYSTGKLSSRTSIGAQYVRTLEDFLGSSGTDLPPGSSTIGTAAIVTSYQNYTEQVTLGSYFEQTLGLSQRLYLTAALRRDGASTFGRNYSAAIYPKAGLSWLISEEPWMPRIPTLNEFRARYAFGASGQQPRPEWARPGYSVEDAFHDGRAVKVYTINSLGNPDLRPERVREHEFGFDATALQQRLEVGLTWYQRRTVDQIVNVSLPPGLGTMQSNLGLTSGHGFEAGISARVLDSRPLKWQIAFQHSFHRTVVNHLGGSAPNRSPSGGWAEGYPLGARFLRPLVGFTDANGDGIIDPYSEIQLGDTGVYAGESTPPRSQTLNSVMQFLDGRLRFSALLERRSGFTQLNSLHSDLCANGLCRALVDPATPLAEQARAGATVNGVGFVESGNFTRFRELAVALDLPSAINRALGLGSTTLALQARNLALWTAYHGADPESGSQGLGSQELGIPQARSWALRFDVVF